jgi:SAM-dependent methyltransferase
MRFARHWILAFLLPRPLVGLLFLPRYFAHWIKYTRSADDENLDILDLRPCLGDWRHCTPFDAHYFYQGAWLARKLATTKPLKHVDIGSSALTVGVLSAHVETLFLDYRPLRVNLSGLESISGDILNLPFDDNSLSSVSCLHVLEHIGLGRYGDPIDPQGSLNAARELQRVLARSGQLLVSLPVGRERVCFNAHRVYAPASVVKMFPELRLVEFSYVDDGGTNHECRRVEEADECEYGCGMFLFERA